MALDLAVGGALMAGLGCLAHYLRPDAHEATRLAGLVGGGLCVLWGILGRRGVRCHGIAMLTLAAMAGVFLRQALHCRNALTAGVVEDRMVMALLAMLLVFSLGALVTLVKDRKDLQP